MASARLTVMLFVLVGGVALSACDQEPVVAGVFRYEPLEMAGAAGAAEAGSGGAGGMAGTAEPTAGSAGGADCTAEPWYGPAQIVTQDPDCVVTWNQGVLFAILERYIPLLPAAGEERGWSSCMFGTWWRMTIEDGDDYLQACPEWCEYIHKRIRQENDRISTCLNMMQAGMGSP